MHMDNTFRLFMNSRTAYKHTAPIHMPAKRAIQNASDINVEPTLTILARMNEAIQLPKLMKYPSPMNPYRPSSKDVRTTKPTTIKPTSTT